MNEFILTRRQAEIARLAGELAIGEGPVDQSVGERLEKLRQEVDDHNVALEVLRLIGRCGFDALQVRGRQDEIHYRRLHRYKAEYGRAVPIVASDAHVVAGIFDCGGSQPYVKIDGRVGKMTEAQFFDNVKTALRFGETRFCYAAPDASARWIAGIEITPDAGEGASEFWPFKALPQDGTPEAPAAFLLPLSRNLNCFIGGRGSGKSAALDALAFVARPEDFDSPLRDEDSDYYKRSRATLGGCQVTLCWQFQSASVGHLRKGRLFSSRYFDPNDRHGAVRHADIDGAEVVPSRIPRVSVDVFRLGELEDVAEPEGLRKLLDDICGDELAGLESRIKTALAALKGSRGQLTGIAKQVHDLTMDGAPLREFVFRSQDYEKANSSQVREAYANSDNASYAERKAQAGTTDWAALRAEVRPGDVKNKIFGFYDALQDAAFDEKGNVRPYCAPIFRLLSPVDPADTISPWCKAAEILEKLNGHLIAVDEQAQRAAAETVAALREARNGLERNGLPAGGQDREAKKQAFEEAQTALAKYRDLVSEWDRLLAQRREEYAGLEGLCKHRTRLRETTAGKVTEQLGLDLNPSVLVIEARAQPMEDKSLFKEWLMKTVGPCLPSKREARVDALLEQGLRPALLRDVLLGEAGSDVLQVQRQKVSQGKIGQEEVDVILSRCSARIRLEPEKKEDECLPEFWERLPQEIREGLWGFPDAMQRLDGILQLDEIVFDDIPVVLLNDRPQESGSRPRPLEELSRGQRCSALLPIILLTGTGPLIIDQPEDNLDNRLIRQVIVNILASIKSKRQVIVATHNPNLPVLGDAEQAVILRAVEDKKCRLEESGPVDALGVCTYIQDIMEGGREAFQYRHSIYQEHWRDSVATE